ncbi:MAG TPA: NADPH:quinone reductase [Verrucomicrobiae bacterium]|jgi:NADPH2:quinone reductase|nr:NADPH:quinone reductase [Verrucomicrobiae bacterium]
MKAIRVTAHGGPEVLKPEEMPAPELGPGQVLVRVRAAGVNPVDTYIRAGAYSISNLPYTPGFDAGGEIEKVGPEVTAFKKGDRVYTSGSISGTYAEFALCNVSTVHKLPPKISFAEGAGLGVPYATAYRALFHRGRAVAAETLLVHGASGGVGTAAIQFARAAGLTVIGTSGSEKGRKLVLENGAHHALDHHSPGFNDELMRLAQNRGVDLILEMLANVNLGKDLALLARFGRVVVIGSRGKVEINPRDTMSRDASIHGMTLFNATESELKSIHAGIYAGLDNGSLRPIVGKEMPLSDAARAHVEILEPGASGKIILVP